MVMRNEKDGVGSTFYLYWDTLTILLMRMYMYQKRLYVYDSPSLDAITSLTFLCHSCCQSPLSRCSLPPDCGHLAWQICLSRVHSPETHSNGYSFCFRISKEPLQMKKRKDNLQNGKRLGQHLCKRPRHAYRSTQMRGSGFNQQECNVRLSAFSPIPSNNPERTQKKKRQRPTRQYPKAALPTHTPPACVPPSLKR